MDITKIEKKTRIVRVIVLITFISFVVLSTLGYIYHPIITACLDMLFIWGIYKWLKKRGIKTNIILRKKK